MVQVALCCVLWGFVLRYFELYGTVLLGAVLRNSGFVSHGVVVLLSLRLLLLLRPDVSDRV